MISAIVRIAVYDKDTGQITKVFSGPEEYADKQVGIGELSISIDDSVSDSSHYISAAKLPVAMPPKPSEAHVFDYTTKLWVDPRPLMFLIDQALQKVNVWRDEQEKIGLIFEHAGRMWDASLASSVKLEKTLKHADPLPIGFFWTDASEPVNVNVVVTHAELQALYIAHEAALWLRGNQIHVRQREMKAALEAMDAEQLAAFVPGWPD